MALDYYDVLKLSSDATHEDVQRAYRVLARRYHPDRNAVSEAASNMTAINEAYSVLADLARRRDYDRKRRAVSSSRIVPLILSASRDAVLKQQWTVMQNDGTNIILKKDTRSVLVMFTEFLTNGMLPKIAHDWQGYLVALAVYLESPLDLPRETTVIDLLHSRKQGADFPDDVYAALFSRFL